MTIRYKSIHTFESDSVFFPIILGSSGAHERKLFMDEIQVMKRVSDGNNVNPHVLKMIGCVTTTHPMMLLLQFVPHGNLRNYLGAMKVGHNDIFYIIIGAIGDCICRVRAIMYFTHKVVLRKLLI